VKLRAFLIAATLAGTFLAPHALSGAGAAEGRTCTWAGTPDHPTGTFTVSPGLTNLPAPGPSAFKATGVLAGDPGCQGTMTWVGQIDAGSTCELAYFEGVVRGLPGVARFVGKGSLSVPSVLYDRSGNVVGTENAEILTPNNQPHFDDCNTPQGFVGGWPGMFSSVLHVNA
jgi:hypothetical protein